MDKNKEFILKGSEPTYLEVRRGEDTIEDAVYMAFMGHLKNTLSGMIVQEAFRSSDVPARFTDEIHTFAPRVADRILEREKDIKEAYGKHANKEYTPLHNAIAELALKDEHVTFAVDSKFIDFLTSEVGKIPDDYFQDLEEYHEALSQTAIIELLGRVEKLVQSKDDRTDWVDQAYRLVQMAAEHPDHYTPPVDLPESIMICAFLNYRTRQLTRRVITGNLLLAKTKEIIGHTDDADENATLSELAKFFKGDSLSGQHWTDNAWHHNINDATVKEMSRQSALKLDALGELERLKETPGGQKVLGANQLAAEHLRETIDMEQNTSHIQYWQQIDTGHAFEGFRSIELRMSMSKNFGELARPKKDKGVAAVLEDDDEQMELWQSILQNRSGYQLVEDSLTASPEKMIELGSNPDIKLLLIDIQNKDDNDAGIKVAKAILDKRLSRSTDEEDEEQTTILVWSTSADSVRQAAAEIDQYLADLPEGQKRLVQAESALRKIENAKGHGHGPIKLWVQLKGLDQWHIR